MEKEVYDLIWEGERLGVEGKRVLGLMGQFSYYFYTAIP
jgi:hypothetical protein